MENKEINYIEINKSLENTTKQRIIEHLKNKKQLNLGSIIKNLRLNPKLGTKYIIELQHLGLIKKVENTSLLELDLPLLQQANLNI